GVWFWLRFLNHLQLVSALFSPAVFCESFPVASPFLMPFSVSISTAPAVCCIYQIFYFGRHPESRAFYSKLHFCTKRSDHGLQYQHLLEERILCSGRSCS